MKAPQTRTTFAGLDTQTTTNRPVWYADASDHTEPVTFAEAIRDLPLAIATEIAYKNPYTEE